MLCHGVDDVSCQRVNCDGYYVHGYDDAYDCDAHDCCAHGYDDVHDYDVHGRYVHGSDAHERIAHENCLAFFALLLV